jgi:transcriptional regulatory protein GAL4
MPICTSCQKFSRACLYERNAKTPLTRQHLTEVEAELARTKAMLEGTIPRQENGSGQDDTPMPLPADAILRDFEPSASGSQPVFSPVQQQFQSQQHRSRSSLAQNEDPAFTTVRPATANGPMVSPQSTRRKSSNMFSLESPPTSGDFEWDERSGRPNGDRFVDGMATLTGDSNDGGYLGAYCA